MLKLIKKGDKYWLFEDSEIGLFSPSKFTINILNNVITIVYENGLKSKNYNVSDCEVYDLDSEIPFTTSNGNDFMEKLESLNCPCFQKNENIFNIYGGAWGSIVGTLSDQTDLQYALDSKLSKAPADYSTATTPLDNADGVIVFQSGVPKLATKADFGGGSDIEDNMHKEWCSVQARYDANGVFTLNTQALTASGTQSVVARGGTSIYSSLSLQNYVTSTATGQNAGLKNNNSSDAVIRQGFDAFFLFANNSTDNQHMTTVGSYSLVSAIPNLPISSFTGDFFGAGNDVSDTNLSFYAHRVTASGQTASYVKVDCGADFPAHTTTDAYLLRMEAPQTEVDTDRFIKMTITNIVTGISFTHTFPYTETPVLGRNFIAVINRNNRNSGTATNIRFGKYNLVKKSY